MKQSHPLKRISKFQCYLWQVHSYLHTMCTGRLCIEPRMKVDDRTSRRTVIIQVKQTQLITKDISLTDRIHVEPLKKQLVVSSLLRRYDVSKIMTICMKGTSWLALCTGRLCIEPLMKMGARTSRHTVIIQAAQTQLITKDISISSRIHVKQANRHLVVSSLLHTCDVSILIRWSTEWMAVHSQGAIFNGFLQFL